MPGNEERAYLQMKTKSSDQTSGDSWQSVSNIQNTTLGAQSKKGDIHASHSQQSDRKDLPMKIKNLLSPNATIKAHRKANYLYRHSSDKIDTNLLIFLHGAGDNHLPYHNLGKKMSIPQCATLSLSASCMNEGFSTLPFGLGHSWFDEMDYSTGLPLPKQNFKLVSSLKRAVKKLDHLLNALTGDGDDSDRGVDATWIPERIFLFGFSAGAYLAMQTCLDRFERGKSPLGGAICVAGGVNKLCTNKFSTLKSTEQKEACEDESGEKSKAIVEKAPVLIIAGSKDDKFTPTELKKAVEFYNSFQATLHSSTHATSLSARSFMMKGKGHDMIKSEEEIKALMGFCAEHMVRRMVAMEDFCEISTDHLE